MKKLVRPKENRKITGLCAGLANYLEIDATVVRILMLAFTLITAILPGVMFYVIASIITPEEA